MRVRRTLAIMEVDGYRKMVFTKTGIGNVYHWPDKTDLSPFWIVFSS